jgi:protein tyrosine/serine phosphatase
VYRSAQPAEEGFAYLKSLGVKNILNLRDYHNDDPGPEKPGLNLYRVPMDAGKIRTADIVDALRFIKRSEGPVLIHCWHGSDRTGTISALYRIVFQNWSKEEALDELMHGGFGYHSIFKNIPEFIRQVDITEIRQMVFAP